MGRPFIVRVNLSNILNDPKETHYTMYVDDTKMTIVYELIEWIRWIFSLKGCFYLTHDNSVIHELEDIKILSELKNIRAHTCDHLTRCVYHSSVHTKLDHLFQKLNFFEQWDGLKVPKLFLNKVNEITQKLEQKDHDVKVLKTDCSSEEETEPKEAKKVENIKLKELPSGDINTCESQLSENVNNNSHASNKTYFNNNSNKKVNDSAVKADDINEVLSIPSGKSEFNNKYNNSSTNFNTNFNSKLNDTMVEMSNSNKIHSVPSDENGYVNAPIKLSQSEIDKIKTLLDKNLSEKSESNEHEQINKSNRKRLPSVSKDKKLNDNKIIKKGPKPFSLGEMLTNLRSKFNASSTDHEINTSTEQNENSSLSNEMINDRMGYCDQNLPNDSGETVTIKKRKRQRKHKSKKPKPAGGDILEGVKMYTLCPVKQSSHVRFPSDDEDISEANHPESDKQSEKAHYDLNKNNGLVEKGIEQSSLRNGKEESLSITQPNVFNDNKVNGISEANKELNTLEKLMYIQHQQSSSANLFEYSNEENQHTNGEANAPMNYDFNLSTLRALRERFPSPMVVERFY